MINNSYQQEVACAIHPDVNSFNLVMEAFLQLNDPARVEDLLLEMDATNGAVSPNSESFSKVIRAWTQNEMNNPAYGLPGSSCENAWKWLDELLQREKKDRPDLGPAPELFSSILKTAAMTDATSENLLSVGQRTFWAMRESRFGVDSFAYAWLLEIGLKVLQSPKHNERRETFVASLAKQCCKDGLLSVRFIRQLADGKVYAEGWTAEESERLGRKVFGEAEFPVVWSRNLQKGQRQPRVQDMVRARTSTENWLKKNNYE